MFRNFLTIFIACIASQLAHGQSITVSLPSTSTFNCSVSGTTISGFGCPFTVAISAAPSIYSVEYDVDGQVMTPPGTAAGGIIYAAPFTSNFDTFYVGNGQHMVVAIARDALNNTLATSAPVAFAVENDMPQNPPGTNCAGSSTCTDISVSVIPGLIATLSLGGPTQIFDANVVSITGTAPAIVGSPVVGSTNPGSAVSISMTFGSGHSGWFYVHWHSASNTMTMADGTDTFVCLSSTQNSTGTFSTQWCYVKQMASGAHTITATLSASSFLTLYGFEVSGSNAAAPLDQNVNLANTTGGLPQSGIYNPASAPELILVGWGWEGTKTAIAGNGYTIQASQTQDAVESASITTLNPFGLAAFTVTVNGPVASQSHTANLFIDGLNVQTISSTTSATSTLIFDSSTFLNAVHNIVVSVTGGTSCTTCTHGWNWMGGYENRYTFANPVVSSQLLASAREVILVGGGPANNCGGGSSCTLTGVLQNTDGSSSAATITSCVPATTGIVTVSGTCTLTHVALGVTSVLMTESGGKTRTVWVYDNPANQTPHFSNTGAIIDGPYLAGSSFWHTSIFGGETDQLAGANAPLYPAAQAVADYMNAGYTVYEASTPAAPSLTTTQTTWQSSTVAGWITTYVNNILALWPGAKVHLIGDPFFRGTPPMLVSLYGPGGSGVLGSLGAYSTPAYQYLMQQVVNTGAAMLQSMMDEVGLAWGGEPLLGLATNGIFVGGNGVVSLIGNGTTCAVTMSNPLAFTGADTLLITGSGTVLDWNATTNSPLFTVTVSGNNFSFPCSYTGTAPTTTQLHPYVAYAFNSLGQGSGSACTSISGAVCGGAPPFSYYIKYNFAATIRAWNTAVTGFPLMTWPAAAGASGDLIADWCGAKSSAGLTLGDYCEVYWSGGSEAFLPGYEPLLDFVNTSPSMGVSARTEYAFMNRAAPFLMETQGTVVDYTPQGYAISVASCSGNTITTSTAHGLTNLFPVGSRLWVSGSGSALCDGNYWVVATPTATTITVALATPTFSGTGTGGTMTFATGSYAVVSASMNGSLSEAGSTVEGPVCPNTLKNQRGNTFTISGNSLAAFNANTFYLSWVGTDPCSQFSNFIWQIPRITSTTGGTAFIVPDNNYIRGRSWQGNHEADGAYIFTSNTYCLILGCAGSRQYSFGAAPVIFDRSGCIQGFPNCNGGSTYDTNTGNSNIYFNQTNPQELQAGINPHWDYARSLMLWMASTHANLLTQRLAKYNLQPRLASPDYGQFFEATARTGSYGNILEIQSFSNNSVQLTASLGAYLKSGQPIGRLCATWAGIQPLAIIAAGTTTDTHTYQQGEFCAYIFAVNEAAEFRQPQLAARLADVQNATDLLVQFSYSPLAFTTPSVTSQLLYQTFDLGSSCVGMLPVDRQIGVLYYRLVYRDTTGRILATSDVQKL